MAEVPVNNLYSNGFNITLTQGRQLLKRNKEIYKPSALNDRSHKLVDGDTLWALAFKFYGDSKLWWIIADVNNIINPLELDTLVGTEIIIPDFDIIKTSRI